MFKELSDDDDDDVLLDREISFKFEGEDIVTNAVEEEDDEPLDEEDEAFVDDSPETDIDDVEDEDDAVFVSRDANEKDPISRMSIGQSDPGTTLADEGSKDAPPPPPPLFESEDDPGDACCCNDAVIIETVLDVVDDVR